MDNNQLWDDLSFEVSRIEKIKKTYEDEDREILIGSGNKSSDILFIGDDKDLYEDGALKVLTGSTGEFLMKLCDMAEISPDSYYLTTLTKSSLKFKDFFEEDQEKLRELLHMQIALISPKIIVALGEGPATCLLNRNLNFLEEKGKLLPWKGDINILVTYDVKYIKESRETSGRSSKAALDFWKDLQFLKKQSDSFE